MSTSDANSFFFQGVEELFPGARTPEGEGPLAALSGMGDSARRDDRGMPLVTKSVSLPKPITYLNFI